MLGLRSLAAAGVSTPAPTRRLLDDQIDEIYMSVPDVRACIDHIVRTIATWDWLVEPHENLWPGQDGYDEAQEAAKDAARFLSAPCVDPRIAAWQSFMTVVLTDLLKYEAGTFEIVRKGKSPTGPVAGFNPLRSIEAVIDEHGITTSYRQVVFGGSEVKFGVDDVVYLSLFPNTLSPYGTPLVETVLDEVITLLRQSEHAMNALADENPPGLLVVQGLGGKAAEQARSDMTHMAGQDHRLRSIFDETKGGIDAKWIEFRRSLKDSDFREIVRDIRRVVWRTFGVPPVEMGDVENTPRAVGEVLERLGQSRLVEPILELVEGVINARILPLILPPESVGLVQFHFDREPRPTPEDRLKRAQAARQLLEVGARTLNEVRADDGMPPIGGGDVPQRLEGGLWVTVGQQPQAEPEEPSEPESDEGTAPAEGDEAAPGEVEETALPSAPCCVAHRAIDLPSEWPKAAMFDGYRTLPLRRLAEEVSRYTGDARDVYAGIERAVVREFHKAWRPDMASEDLAELSGRVGAVLDEMPDRWAATTAPRYRATAKLAAEKVREWTGIADAVPDAADRGDAYRIAAMGYLEAGLVESLRRRMRNLLLPGATLRAVVADGALIVRDDDRDPLGIMISAVSEEFAREAYRIENWSGKLIDLAGEVMGKGLTETTPSLVWMAEWVDVGDSQECEDCMGFAAMGIKPILDFGTQPGGLTQCGGRDRCVLVVWTAEEVANGTAVRLGSTG